MSDPIAITVYSRDNCHLCAEAKETIQRVSEETGTPIELSEIDVDTDEALRERYGERVPYVMIEGRPAYKYRVDEADLRDRFDR